VLDVKCLSFNIELQHIGMSSIELIPKTYLSKKNIINNRAFVKEEQYDVNFQKSKASWVRQETGGIENHCEGS